MHVVAPPAGLTPAEDLAWRTIADTLGLDDTAPPARTLTAIRRHLQWREPADLVEAVSLAAHRPNPLTVLNGSEAVEIACQIAVGSAPEWCERLSRRGPVVAARVTDPDIVTAFTWWALSWGRVVQAPAAHLTRVLDQARARTIAEALSFLAAEFEGQPLSWWRAAVEGWSLTTPFAEVARWPLPEFAKPANLRVNLRAGHDAYVTLAEVGRIIDGAAR